MKLITKLKFVLLITVMLHYGLDNQDIQELILSNPRELVRYLEVT